MMDRFVIMTRTYNDQTVNVTSVFKYMGILLAPKLSWVGAKLKLISQAKHLFLQLDLSRETLVIVLILKTLNCVKPTLLHGDEIWGTEFYEDIERVQIKYCKAFLGVCSSTNDSIVLGDIFPLFVDYCIKL